MRLIAKIALITILCLLVLFAILSDLPLGRNLEPLAGLGLYLKLVSLLGLVALGLLAWGHKRQVEASQKYRRADEVLAQAEAAFERKRQSCDQLEQRLKEIYAEKEKGLDDQIEQVRTNYQQQMNALKEQNIELKESVAKLMSVLKRRKK